MSAYLTSVNFLPHHRTAKDSLCPINSAPLTSDKLEPGEYGLLWDYFENTSSSELSIMFAFMPQDDRDAEQSFNLPALPYFSNEVLREKIIDGLGTDPLNPSVSFKSSVAVLGEHFDALSPMEMVDQLRKIQEWEFLESLRREIDFLPESDDDHTFRALHEAISTSLTNPALKRYVYERPLVLHPGMADHVYFKDLRSLQANGHVHPINLEDFGPDDTSQIDYD